MRPSWIAVDLTAIEANTAAIARAVQPAALCAVVKADGYGHGDVPVAEAALKGGATWLATALAVCADRRPPARLPSNLAFNFMKPSPPPPVPQFRRRAGGPRHPRCPGRR